jgi:signal transduction histidine kinase
MRQTTTSDQTRTCRPAAVFVIDLVSHSTRNKEEIQSIQAILEDTIHGAVKSLNLADVMHKHTGDGYLCVFPGDTSARVLDFVSLLMPDLRRNLSSWKQSTRAGLDFGLLTLKHNSLTGSLEHFDLPGIQAVRLEQACEPDKILVTETARNIFTAFYPNQFSREGREIQTKDRKLIAYELYPADYRVLQSRIRDFLEGTFQADLRVDTLTRPLSALVVDDEASVLRLATVMLRSAFPGMRVVVASDGEIALRILKEETFGILITDLTMPRMTGAELIKHVARFDPSLPIVIASGFADDLDGDLLEQSVDFVLSKPYQLQTLASVVSHCFHSSASEFHRSFRQMCRGLRLDSLEQARVQYQQIRSPTLVTNVTHSLINHKAAHCVNDFVRLTLPGNDIAAAYKTLRTQLSYLGRLRTTMSNSGTLSPLTFLKQYALDQEKRIDTVSITVKARTEDEACVEEVEASSDLILILTELVDNAISATEGTGKVVVAFSVLLSSRSLMVTVADDGPGIPREIQPRIFDNGFSTKGSGRGFGLFLAKEALSRHGGDIRYEFRGGARFMITIPLRETRPVTEEVSD